MNTIAPGRLPRTPMTRTLIRNIGEFFTGDITDPVGDASAMLLENGLIAALDPSEADASAGECDVVIDARGGAVLPGLVDGHVHPVLGEWTPMQNALGWIGNYVHGGTTTFISAGVASRPRAPSP